MSSVSSPISIDLESISIDLRVSGPFPPAEIPVDLEKVIVSNSWCEDPPNVPNAELPRADGTLGRETRGRNLGFWVNRQFPKATAKLSFERSAVLKDCWT